MASFAEFYLGVFIDVITFGNAFRQIVSQALRASSFYRVNE